MLNRTNLLIIILAIASAGFGLGLSVLLRPPQAEPVQTGSTGAGILAVGETVADIRLPDRDGNLRDLADWRGKLVVLNFWASWCGPCREEMPMLDRARSRYAARGVEIIGVASEEAPAALEFLEHNPVSYPILINAPQDALDVSLHLGNRQSVLPYTVLIARDGRVLATRMGNFSEQAFDAWVAPFL